MPEWDGEAYRRDVAQAGERAADYARTQARRVTNDDAEHRPQRFTCAASKAARRLKPPRGLKL